VISYILSALTLSKKICHREGYLAISEHVMMGKPLLHPQSSSAQEKLPPLESGDRLTRPEFQQCYVVDSTSKKQMGQAIRR
jgi:hypothetical protein